MAKSRWQLGCEQLAEEFRRTAAGRRVIVAMDPAAEALDYAAAVIEQKVRTLLDPTAMLTPDEWAAEQDPPVAGGTARRWCREGELECIETPRGYLIPVGAVRKPKGTLRLLQELADYEEVDAAAVVFGDATATDAPREAVG